MHRKNKKLPIWMLIAFSAIAIFSTAISSFAWFTLIAPPSSSMVTGSSEVDIESVTALKVQETRKANGYVNYDNDIVTAKDISASEYSTKENKNLQGEELNFDVPPDGIGYYIVIPNTLGTYKFSSQDKNYAKLSRYEDSYALSANIYISQDDTFVIRSYQMKNHKTQLSTLTITEVGDNGNGVVLNTEENEVIVKKSGYYKAWVVLNALSDATSCKAGLEYISATAPNANPQGKATPRNLPSTVTSSCTLWFRDGLGWKNDSAKIYAYVFTDGGSQAWVQMNYAYDGDGGNPMYYGTVPAGTYAKALFVRGNSSWTVTNPWTNLYNQTEDLIWPSGNNNCFNVTSWHGNTDWNKCAGSWEDNSRQIKIGTGSTVEMNWIGDTWTYQIPSVAANNTTVTFYKNHSSSALSVTRDDDSSAQLPSVNNFLNGKIRTAGTNLDVYLHTGNSVWINVPATATATVGGTEYPLTYDSVKEEWSATLSDVADNSAVTISYGGITQTVTPSDNPSEWWKQNNFIDGQIKGGAETLSIYLHKDRTVWVDCVIDIQCGSGTRHRMVENPGSWDEEQEKYTELYATGIDLTAGESITMRINGSAFTYNVDPGSYNNVSSGKKAVKTASSQAAYIKLDSKNLWVEGNKTYKVKVGTAEAVEMHYLSSGTFAGWYGIESQNVSASAVTVTLNDTAVTGVTAETTKMPNNNTNGTSILRGGTVSIYYDTENKRLAVTPIYSIKIGSQDIVATLSSGSTYTAEFLSFADDASVDVYINSTRQTDFTPEAPRVDARNNCYGTGGSLKTENGVATATTATFDLSAKTVWIDGYSPKYFAKVGTGDYQEMTQSPTNESEYYLDIVGTAGNAVSFRKNASNTGYDAQVSILGPDTQNNLDSNKCIITTVSTAKRLCLNIDTNKVWFAGREINLQFHDAALSTFAYLWNSGDDSIKNADFPGKLMTTIEDNVHTYTYVIGDAPLDRLVLSNGTSQSADIDLTDSQYYANNYVYLNQLNDEGKYNVAVRNEIASNHLYVYDPATYLGSVPHAYAWGGSGPSMSMPGVPMAAIVPGCLWAANVASTYTNVLFADKALANYSQTSDLTISEGTNKIFVTTSKDGTSVSGGWKGQISATSTNAYIYVGGQAQGTKMAPGDNVDSNKYIYELGIQAAHGQTLRVEDNGVAITQFDSKMSTLPYLSINGTTITVNLGQSGATARFNFYVTMDGTLSIVMVPDLGNGFYIMPYASSVEGFVGAHKMSSKDNSGAMYAGYYADKNQKIYLRSYVDAVDVPYTLDESVSPELATEVAQIDGCSVIQFEKSSYYTIEVSGGKVKIQAFAVQDFLKVNSLDQYNRSVTKQSDILAQHTSLVLSVKFKPTNPAISMTPTIQVTNNASDYIGAAVAFGADPVDPSFDPYTYMRDTARYKYDSSTNPNGLAKRESSFSLSDPTFVTDANPDRSYYAYILVDYVYSASLATMPYADLPNIVFYLKMEQAV